MTTPKHSIDPATLANAVGGEVDDFLADLEAAAAGAASDATEGEGWPTRFVAEGGKFAPPRRNGWAERFTAEGAKGAPPRLRGWSARFAAEAVKTKSAPTAR